MTPGRLGRKRHRKRADAPDEEPGDSRPPLGRRLDELTLNEDEAPHSMNLSRPFILRPVATVLLMVAILLVGMVGYRQLPVSALPQVDYPTIQVVTFYPGAGPT